MERFAGLTPGLMLVLGADINAEDIEFGDPKTVQRIEDWFQNENVGQYEAEFWEWAVDLNLEIEKILGSGMYGLAIQVKKEGESQDLVVKLSSHEDEKNCVEWIQQHPNASKHLPEIMAMGEPQGSRRIFWYLRLKYEQLPMEDWKRWIDVDWKTTNDSQLEREFMIKIFKDTNEQFWPFDAHEGNVGIGPGGTKIYFDPACALGPDIPGVMTSWIREKLLKQPLTEVREEIEAAGGDPGWIEKYLDPSEVREAERQRWRNKVYEKMTKGEESWRTMPKPGGD